MIFKDGLLNFSLMSAYMLFNFDFDFIFLFHVLMTCKNPFSPTGNSYLRSFHDDG